MPVLPAPVITLPLAVAGGRSARCGSAARRERDRDREGGSILGLGKVRLGGSFVRVRGWVVRLLVRPSLVKETKGETKGEICLRFIDN